MSSARAKSTWLTGAAGLMLLVAAFVMMVYAAPRAPAVGHDSVTPDRLASWVWSTQEDWVWGPPHANDGFVTVARASAPQVP